MIASCNCLLTANCPITLSNYNLEQNTETYAPITFEEIVIVMMMMMMMMMMIIIITNSQVFSISFISVNYILLAVCCYESEV